MVVREMYQRQTGSGKGFEGIFHVGAPLEISNTYVLFEVQFEVEGRRRRASCHRQTGGFGRAVSITSVSKTCVMLLTQRGEVIVRIMLARPLISVP